MSLILSHLAAAAGGSLATLALLGPYLRSAHRRLAAAEYRASHDALTGLANRRAVLAHLREATVRTDPVGVILLDLDDFKTVNDTLGHASGDDLLLAVARLLKALPAPVRLAGRLGGDEFVVAVDGNADTTAAVAHDIWTLITGAPFTIAGRTFEIGASVGHVSSRLGWSARQLLYYADLAMYDAKRAGGGITAYHRIPADREVPDRPPQRCRDRRRTGGDPLDP